MLELIQVPVWRDNYAYLVVHGVRAFVVDSPEAAPVLDALAARPEVKLEAVVNTHHHPDHVGSNRTLMTATGCAVVGPTHDKARIPGHSVDATIGECVEVAGVELDVLDVRAHTRGHIAYATRVPIDRVVRHGHGGAATVVDRLAGRTALFVGDSLFLGGCGRLFEGTATQLEASMRVLAARDPQSLVCCAHEYTASNLSFAASVLPDDRSIAARVSDLENERRASGSSVPDILARELETNPFVMALDDDVSSKLAARLGVADPSTERVIGALRAAKDRF